MIHCFFPKERLFGGEREERRCLWPSHSTFHCFVIYFSSITGTLTQNEMIFKRLHLGTVSYGTDTMDEIQSHIINSYSQVFHKPFTFCIEEV